MEKPKEITVTDEEYNAVIGRMQLSDLSDADKLLIISMCSWYKYLIMLVQETKITLKRLREMLGWCCKKISRKNKSKACESSAQSDEESSSCEDLSQAAANTNGETPNSSSPEKKKRPGHGRLGHKAYTGAVNEYHTHEHMKAGDICPQCGLGKMYLMPPNPSSGLEVSNLLSFN